MKKGTKTCISRNRCGRRTGNKRRPAEIRPNSWLEKLQCWLLPTFLSPVLSGKKCSFSPMSSLAFHPPLRQHPVAPSFHLASHTSLLSFVWPTGSRFQLLRPPDPKRLDSWMLLLPGQSWDKRLHTSNWEEREVDTEPCSFLPIPWEAAGFSPLMLLNEHHPPKCGDINIIAAGFFFLILSRKNMGVKRKKKHADMKHCPRTTCWLFPSKREGWL